MIGVPKSPSCYGKHGLVFSYRKKNIFLIFPFSATAQWFANVEHLQQKSVDALKNVRMIPEVCKLRFVCGKKKRQY